MKPRVRLLFSLTLLISVASAQIAFHGKVNPLVRLTLDERYLSLPHRFLVLDGEHRGDGVGLYFSTALEYRLNTNQATLDLREVYAEISTNLGDFRFGKQIYAWGAADGNNPTDNVNPYDFYYLFLPGTDRKIGVTSLSANLYFGNLNVEAVIIPVFSPNRLPLNEPDFPIFGDGLPDITTWPVVSPNRELDETEAGLRIRLPLSLMDVSASYFRGFERMFSATAFFDPASNLILPGLKYLKTQVFGADLVTFLGNWAIRAEGAYFITEDKVGRDPEVRNPYLQYVGQVDYQGSAGSWMVQYLGTFITGLDGDDVSTELGFWTEEENEKDNLPAKMGMPFAAIAQNAIMATGSIDLAASQYTVRLQVLVDLDNGGLMTGGGLEVHLADAFDLEIGLTILGGDEGSRLKALKDFSHFSAGLSYSF